MCTVSFIKLSDGLVFTSSRDEHESRALASGPHLEEKRDMTVLYPKDGCAGGTWVAANEQGAIAILLNGAYMDYARKRGYKKSRGLVLLDVISSPMPILALKQLNLRNIAPFTVVLFHEGELYQLRWDGHQLYDKSLCPDLPHIWSSATLYSFEEQHTRKYRFHNMTQDLGSVDAKAIWTLHHVRDEEGGFLINRPSGHRTVSISQLVVKNKTIDFTYDDLVQKKKYATSLVVGEVKTACT